VPLSAWILRVSRTAAMCPQGPADMFVETLSLYTDRLIAALAQPEQAFALGSAAVATLLVIISAFVRTMIPLRWLAVGSNVGFIVYGLVHPSLLMVLLHVVLLPVNLWRVLQMVRLTRVVSAAADREQIALWLRPHMRSRRHKAGTVLFERGAAADRLYFLADGEMDLPDVGRQLQAGQMFGEIAFFTPGGRRTSSARCRTACTVLSIDAATFKQLIYQNPDFGLEVLRLVAARLSQDVQRLRAEAAGTGA
jgi:CRP/FNR family transcriptional regulator, cyclic AMP receptor protein